jgi:hypothetical protein
MSIGRALSIGYIVTSMANQGEWLRRKRTRYYCSSSVGVSVREGGVSDGLAHLLWALTGERSGSHPGPSAPL